MTAVFFVSILLFQVRVMSIYYNNRTVQAVVELKNKLVFSAKPEPLIGHL